MSTTRTASQGPAPRDSALARLVHTETRLDALLEARRAEAENLVTEGRRRAAAILAEAEADLSAQAAELATRLEREQAEQLAALRREAQVRQRRLAGIDEDRIDELARWAADRILAEIGTAS